MFGKGFKLFSVFGFEVRMDASWFILAVLIILSLTTGYFPLYYQNLSGRSYFTMGVVGAFGLFASIVIHELCHSLVARRYGIGMKGISLFMFGGVSMMENDSRTPKGEFLMAIAGPLASFALSGLFYLLHAGIRGLVPVPVYGIVGYLGWINLILAFFNLLPAFPLDGGRVLRSVLWAWRGNLRWATLVASRIGSGFALMLIGLGLLSLLARNFVGGLWWCLIGMFMRGVSQSSYQQVVISETLAGERVSRFMRKTPITVPPSLGVEELVNDFIYRYHFKMFPVVEGETLVGSVTTREVRDVRRDEWGKTRVGDIAKVCSPGNTISPGTSAAEALSVMNKTGNSRLMVADQGRLLGILSTKDLLRFLALKLNLEGEGPESED